MESARTILRYLRNFAIYLNQFHQSQQPPAVERLIVKSISHILHLPFYTIANDDTNIPNRVIWQGTSTGNQLSKAPQNTPDGVAHCYGFHLIIEATKSVGANQWAREFAPAVRHCNNFASQHRIQPSEVYIILVAPELHHDTYQSLHNHPRQNYMFIPLEVTTVAEILETSVLAFTLKHLELRRLFVQIPAIFQTTSSLRRFRQAMGETIVRWRKNVLRNEKSAIIGLKSYEAMLKIEREHQRRHVSTSEILRKLRKHSTVLRYLNLIEEDISLDIIEESLVHQSLACLFSQTPEGETLFSSAPVQDFKARGLRLIESVDSINR